MDDEAIVETSVSQIVLELRVFCFVTFTQMLTKAFLNSQCLCERHNRYYSFTEFIQSYKFPQHLYNLEMYMHIDFTDLQRLNYNYKFANSESYSP